MPMTGFNPTAEVRRTIEQTLNDEVHPRANAGEDVCSKSGCHDGAGCHSARLGSAKSCSSYAFTPVSEEG